MSGAPWRETAGVKPLVLLHGFTGSARSWDHLRPALEDSFRLITPDLIGHGQAPRPEDPARYTLEWATRDLCALLDDLGVGKVILVGYSMGGRVALHVALHAPERISALVLESASPGIEDAAERQRRAEADNALAERILRNGIPAFVARWEQQPLLALAPHVDATTRRLQHELRLQNNARGLANSLRGMGAGQQQPLWSRLGELSSLRVHLLAGELDPRYCAIARRMQAQIAGAELLIVSQAGHTAHVDQPDAFVRQVKKLT